MFSLIITLIATALVAALTLATVYYGGDIFGKYGVAARATRLFNDSAQIEVAMQLYRADHEGALPSTLADLTKDEKYLKGVSSTWTDSVAYISTQNTDIEDEVCLEFNSKKGVPYIPSCTDPSYLAVVICCLDPTP